MSEKHDPHNTSKTKYKGSDNPFVAWVNADPVPDSAPWSEENVEKFRREPVYERQEKSVVSEEERLKRFNKVYKPLAVVLCCAFIALLVFVCFWTPPFGVPDAPTNNEVAAKYIEDGLADTGATNVVAGMILDYRAFDTLGESSVLFTAVMSVMILLRKDKDGSLVNDPEEDKALKKEEAISVVHRDVILKTMAGIIAPFVILFGIYVVLNGHISPGGGFSGGAIIGAGLILIAQGFGSEKTKKFFNFKIFTIITSCSLLSYAALKCFSFYTGSHHIETGIPHGIPGAILSSGFILPLNIFVGLIVACTMFGFYSLFTKGEI